mgnify:CR=1 FL=1
MPLSSAAPAHRFALAYIPPLALRRGVLTAVFVAIGLAERLRDAGCWFYGTAVATGGALSARIVSLMGLSFMALGAVARCRAGGVGALDDGRGIRRPARRLRGGDREEIRWANQSQVVSRQSSVGSRQSSVGHVGSRHGSRQPAVASAGSRQSPGRGSAGARAAVHARTRSPHPRAAAARHRRRLSAVNERLTFNDPAPAADDRRQPERPCPQARRRAAHLVRQDVPGPHAAHRIPPDRRGRRARSSTPGTWKPSKKPHGD